MRSPLAAMLTACALLLAACGSEDADPTPTSPAPAATPPTPAGPVASPTARPASPDAGAGMMWVSDGVCRASVPATWTEDSPGTGTTPSGHRFSIFGNHLTSDDAWETAISLLEEQESRQPDAQITEGPNFIRVTYAGNDGFAYRARFGDIYCDLRVTTRGGTTSDSEHAAWEAIIESLGPATSPGSGESPSIVAARAGNAMGGTDG